MRRRGKKGDSANIPHTPADQLPLFFCVAWSLRIQGIIHINTSPTVSWKEFLTHYILAAPATFLYIVLPLYMKGPKGLAFFFMCNGILGITYGLLFSVSHVNTLVQFDPTGTQLEKQMRTTADYNSGSWLVNCECRRGASVCERRHERSGHERSECGRELSECGRECEASAGANEASAGANEASASAGVRERSEC
jgi:hypothetical protein